MPVAVALFVVAVFLTICLFGILWSLLFLMPFYAIVGVAVIFLWRIKRHQKAIARSVERDAERQRRFNEQETNAWRSAIENDDKNTSKRDRILRSIDRSRDPHE